MAIVMTARKEVLQIRLSDEEKEQLKQKSKEFGFDSISEYLRYVGINCSKVEVKPIVVS